MSERVRVMLSTRTNRKRAELVLKLWSVYMVCADLERQGRRWTFVVQVKEPASTYHVWLEMLCRDVYDVVAV